MYSSLQLLPLSLPVRCILFIKHETNMIAKNKTDLWYIYYLLEELNDEDIKSLKEKGYFEEKKEIEFDKITFLEEKRISEKLKGTYTILREPEVKEENKEEKEEKKYYGIVKEWQLYWCFTWGKVDELSTIEWEKIIDIDAGKFYDIMSGKIYSYKDWKIGKVLKDLEKEWMERLNKLGDEMKKEFDKDPIKYMKKNLANK